MVAYFTLSLGLFGGSMYVRRLSPETKRRWHHRLALLTPLALSPFFIVPPLIQGQWQIALVFLAVIIVIMAGLYRDRVCTSCGTVTKAEHFFAVAKHCRQCGAKLPGPVLLRSAP
jgi:hypothetical protein